MLIISVRFVDGIKTFMWGKGEPFPVYSAPAISEVIEVWANNQELEYIATHFTGIPLCTRYVEHSWYGDTAKFIVGCVSRAIRIDEGMTGDAV